MSFKSNVGKPWVEPTPDQCEMVAAGRLVELAIPCREPYVGTVPECCNVRVCSTCATQMERENFSVSYRDGVRFVLVHPEMGIYLGAAPGLGFWSKLDPVGQDAAVTFYDRHDAGCFMATWKEGHRDGVMVWPVVPDEASTDGLGANGVVYASVAACVAAGLDAWDPLR